MRRTRRHNSLHLYAGISFVLLAFFALLWHGKPSPRIPLFPTTGGVTMATDVLGQLDGNDTAFFSSGGPNNGPNARGFVSPTGVAIDAKHHRLFINDAGANRILVYNLTAENILNDRIADNVLGQTDFKSAGEATSSSGLNDMYGLAFDSAHDRLFVADRGNNRILVFDLSDGITNGMPASFELGQHDDGNPFDSADVATTRQGMNAPRAVVYDAAQDRLFVSEQGNNRVVVFDLSGGITNGMSASFELGQPDDNNPFDSAEGATTRSGMRNPSGISYDSADEILFVADTNNRRILGFRLSSGITNGMPASFELGQSGDADPYDSAVVATSRSGLAAPAGISYDSVNKQLFVADTANKRILVFKLSGGITNGMAASFELGQPNDNNPFDSAGSATTRRRMDSPFDVFYDATRNQLYVADANNRILVFDVAAIGNGEDAVDILGQLDEHEQPVYSTSGINNTPNHQGFDAPGSVVIDSVHNRWFVVDTNNNRILVFNSNTDGSLPDHGADNVLGQPGFKSNGAGTTPQTLRLPTRAVYDSLHDALFIVDSGNNRVLVYDTKTITNGEPAVGVLGQTGFNAGGSGTSASRFANPQGVSVEEHNGVLAVGDAGNNRAVLYYMDPFTGLPVDGKADRVFGQSDFSSSRPGTSDRTLNNPGGVRLDEQTNSLWVADRSNNRVMRFDLSGVSGSPATAVLGQQDFNTQDAATTQRTMNNPGDISILASGSEGSRLLVSDTDNNRILAFAIPVLGGVSINGEDAIDVLGQTDFVTNECQATNIGLCAPTSVGYDQSQQTLFVADSGNNRVLFINAVAGPDVTPAEPLPSSAASPSGGFSEPSPSIVASPSGGFIQPSVSIEPTLSPVASASEPDASFIPSPPISVPDTVAPVISLIGDGAISLAVGDMYDEAGALATDDVDGAVTVVISGFIDTNATGSYTINYNATDAAGNNADEVVRTVIVGADALGFPSTGFVQDAKQKPWYLAAIAGALYVLLAVFVFFYPGQKNTPRHRISVRRRRKSRVLKSK